jgi:hypothetical protein
VNVFIYQDRKDAVMRLPSPFAMGFGRLFSLFCGYQAQKFENRRSSEINPCTFNKNWQMQSRQRGLSVKNFLPYTMKLLGIS